MSVPIISKYIKFYVRISQLLTTRSSIQVKSHHQKMLDKYKSIPRIIEYISL